MAGYSVAPISLAFSAWRSSRSSGQAAPALVPAHRFAHRRRPRRGRRHRTRASALPRARANGEPALTSERRCATSSRWRGSSALVAQRGQRAFQRQTAADQTRQLAGPHRQPGRREHPRRETQALTLGTSGCDLGDFPGAPAPAPATVSVQHARCRLRRSRWSVCPQRSAPRICRRACHSLVTLITSSGEVMPSATSRSPSSRIERRPASSAATKSCDSAARLWIIERTLSSATIIS